jgi:hypothetical protein
MTTIIGSSGNIKVSQDENGDYIIDIDPTFGGQVSICTVGTIKVGQWEGYAIAPQYGGTGTANENSLQWNGPLNIISDPKSTTNIKILRSGTAALQEETLQISNKLAELKTADESIKNTAFGNIAPTDTEGDLIVHSKNCNEKLSIGKAGQVLTVQPNRKQKVAWENLPSAYSTIFNEDEALPQTKDLGFHGPAFCAVHDSYLNRTAILTAKNLDSLALHSTPGIMVYGGANNFFSCCLKGENGIAIEDCAGISKDPVIRIAHDYEGQGSISKVGTIRNGTWCANQIAPEFGGTGTVNRYPINIGGDFITNTSVTIRDIKNEASKVSIFFNGPSKLLMPNEGTVATEQKSLQCKNNLGDVQNTRLALKVLSPTKQRGDLLAQGFGFLERIPLGQPGEVLTVAHTSENENDARSTGIEWKKPVVLEEVLEECMKIMNERIKSLEEKRKAEKQSSTETLVTIALQMILKQFDSMMRNGTMVLQREFRDFLSKHLHELI